MASCSWGLPDIIGVRVTQENIDHGIVGSTGSCPIALAVKRVLGDNCSVIVAGNVTVRRNGDEATYPLPATATTFINRFDCKMHVSPIEFQVVCNP